MHMADTLISPAVGGVMWAVSAGILARCCGKLKHHLDGRLVPLMGVLGAFVFAAQMINFTIPGTGSSGHLGGGMLLAILLGPYAAFVVTASVLTVQALFFADGGLLALGCNMFNMGFVPCFLAYSFVYRPLAGAHPSRGRIMAGAVMASVVGLQLGAFGVVLQTVFSGISELPFNVFVTLMQPIHLAIGLVEGFVTGVVVLFVWQARPELLSSAGLQSNGLQSAGLQSAGLATGGLATGGLATGGQGSPLRSLKGLAGAFALAACLVGGVLSWYASEFPDGLEWAVEKTTASIHAKAVGHGDALIVESTPSGALVESTPSDALVESTPSDALVESTPSVSAAHAFSSALQEKTALLPDYALPQSDAVASEGGTTHQEGMLANPRVGTSLSGLVGGILTLLLAVVAGLLLKRRRSATGRVDA